MEKICLYCGNPFISKAHHQKYCSEKCRDHTRWNTTRAEQKRKTKQDTEEIIKLYDSDLSTKEISQRVNRGSTFIYEVWHDAGLPKRLTPYQKSVLKLRQEGLCSVEIAERLNVPAKQIRTTAQKIGFPFTEEQKRKSIAIGLERTHGSVNKRIKATVDFITENRPDWEYVSGFIGSDSFMTLKCKKCGAIVQKSAVTIRHKDRELICESCSELNKIRKAESHKKQIEENLQQKKISKMAAYSDKADEQMSFNQCVICNNLFFSVNNRIKTCSERCHKTYANWQGKDKRLKKIKDRLVDKDISLINLYKRDKGICWICKGECDYKDYETTEDGYFIVHDNYPSIDHVIPLAKGGEHSWDNVKLAHHRCNTLKSDKVVNMA